MPANGRWDLIWRFKVLNGKLLVRASFTFSFLVARSPTAYLCYIIFQPLSQLSPVQFSLHGQWNRSPFDVFEPNGTHHQKRKWSY